jgi:hypothetical protein
MDFDSFVGSHLLCPAAFGPPDTPAASLLAQSEDGAVDGEHPTPISSLLLVVLLELEAFSLR